MAISCPSLWTDFCLETKGDIQITFQKCNRQDVQLARSASCPLDVLIDLTDVVDLVMATLAQSQCDIFRRAVCNLLKIADRCYNLELSGTLPPSWDAIPNSRPTFHSLEMLTVKHPSWLQKSFLSNTPVLCDVVLEGAPVDIPSLDLEHKSLTSVSLIQCSGGLLDVMRFLRPLSPRLRYLKVHSWAASTIGDDMEATGLLTPMSFPVPNQLIFETDESADASSSFMQQVLRHMSAPALTRRFLHKGLNNDQLPAIRHILPAMDQGLRMRHRAVLPTPRVAKAAASHYTVQKQHYYCLRSSDTITCLRGESLEDTLASPGPARSARTGEMMALIGWILSSRTTQNVGQMSLCGLQTTPVLTSEHITGHRNHYT
ncbi:hypothetical protein BDV98DRAFT_655560 [Pterulicium gracile]|uniref:F-box domain-containing protein n=1 Tax=Pterulicium gracile TaxID=1884261 RepID=A0A5C3QKU9_9AGAR|nr:hypothetical protein BDV98DRAFT_655560 [Pterula gracilis]